MSEVHNNALGRRESTVYEIDAKREKLAGPSGVAGLLNNRRLLGICMVTALGGLNYGYEQGSYGQCMVMPSFIRIKAFDRILNDASYKGLTVAILGIGGWAGALINGYCCDRFSRRWSIFGGALICVVGAVLTTAAVNPDMIFAGRFFIGLAVGSLSTAVPMYNAEISPAEVRGAMVGTWQLSVTFGIMLSYWIGFGMNYVSDTNSVAWRVPLAIQAVPAIILAIGCFFIPYSPRWLLSKGRDDQALNVLARLRKKSVDDESVRLEYLEIKADALFEQEINRERYPQYLDKPLALQFAKFISLFATWPMFKRTAICCLMMFFQQMSGVDAIVFYAPTIFGSLGIGATSISLLASGVVGIAMFLATIPSLFIMDSLGRRPLLVVGGLGMAVCLAVVAGLTGSFEDNWPAHTAGGWAAAVFIWIYIAWFGVSWGPVSWVVISEIMPMSARAPGTAMGASANWATNVAVSYMVPPLMEKAKFGTYIFFLVFMLMGVAYAIWMLPETRDVSLEAMDRVFGSNDSTHDKAIMDRIVAQLESEDGHGDVSSTSSGKEKAGAEGKGRDVMIESHHQV